MICHELPTTHSNEAPHEESVEVIFLFSGIYAPKEKSDQDFFPGFKTGSKGCIDSR